MSSFRGNVRARFTECAVHTLTSDLVTIPDDLLSVSALALIMKDFLVAVFGTRCVKGVHQPHLIPPRSCLKPNGAPTMRDALKSEIKGKWRRRAPDKGHFVVVHSKSAEKLI